MPHPPARTVAQNQDREVALPKKIKVRFTHVELYRELDHGATSNLVSLEIDVFVRLMTNASKLNDTGEESLISRCLMNARRWGPRMVTFDRYVTNTSVLLCGLCPLPDQTTYGSVMSISLSHYQGLFTNDRVGARYSPPAGIRHSSVALAFATRTPHLRGQSVECGAMGAARRAA